MLLPILIGLLIVIVVWLAQKWWKVRNYWAERGVAHDPPHFILGSLTFLMKMNPYNWMRQQYIRFPSSPYIGIWLFWRPAIIIKSPELAKNVLVKDFDVFRDRFLSSGKTDPIGGLNIFTVNDPTWSSVRKRLTSVFTAVKLRSMFPLKQTKAKELVQRIKNENEKGNRVDLKELFTSLTTDIIGAAAFGVAGDATLTGDSPMRAVTRDFMQFSVLRGLAWMSIFYMPELVDICRFKMFPKSSTDYFRKVFKAVVQQRGGWDKEESNSKDLLDALVKLKKDAAIDGEDMSEDLILSQGIIFLQGGFDTSATTLTMATYELAHHPEIQEKLYTELKQAKEELKGEEYDSVTLGKLVYLNCFIKETLRKYTPMGWLDRIASRDYQVDENLTIKKGTPVYVNVIGMQYDPEYFPEPKKFDPDRFLPENESKITPFTYMPFGDGPRNCIGKRFALQSVQNAVAEMVTSFELKPHPGSVTPEIQEIEMDAISTLLAPKKTLSVQFIPRN